MDDVSSEVIRRAVQAQAGIRVKLGVPVAAIAIAVAFNDAAPGKVGPLVGVIGTYIAYAVLSYVVSRRPGRLSWHEFALGTAVLDPVIYSAWLFFGGESAILVVGFYIFTILGFGFRIGPQIMRLCQGVSILGFAWVLVGSPFWKTHPFFGLSHLILLLAVPMYAGALMRELREAKARAERESQAKNQLLANVSHELRTPLTGIVSAAQLLEAGSTSRETDRLVGNILQLSSSLDTEISQLLDLSRQAQGVPAASVPFDVRSVTSNVETALAETALAKGLQLQVDVDPAIDRLLIGRARDLESVLMNLAGNAVKFTTEGSVRIAVRLLDAEDGCYRLEFSVTDTGIGIPEEHQARLFEPFYRVETGDRRQYRGTGLGTTIALEHVRRMGGELQLTSRPGAGSRFWFEATFATTAEPVLGAPEKAPACAVAPPKRILIADDNATNLELLHQMLLKDGHDVVAVASGLEALQQLVESDFDVLMLDFNMGDVDGLTVYETYRFGRLQPAPTFFITADASDDTAIRLGRSGAAGVIHKPLTFDKLRGALLSVFAPAHTPRPQSPASGPAHVVRLAAVPIELVDTGIVETLREVKDQPGFIVKMLGDGMADIRELHPQLARSLADRHLGDVHSRAHALRGVALSVGAVRLGALCERLMRLQASQLGSSADTLCRDLDATTEGSLTALERLRSPFVDAISKSAT